MFSTVSYIDKVLFTKHLSVMIKSGISILEAIDIIEEQTSNHSFKKVLNEIKNDISNGKELYKAVGKHNHIFDPLFINLIKLGEESGNLEKNLEYLADQMKKNYEFSKKVQGALMYPMIVMTTAIAVGFGLSFFVLPQLIDLFESMDIVLPLSTRILLGIAWVMKNYGVYIFIVIIGLLTLLRLSVETKLIKPIWHNLLLRLPVFGPFIQNVELSFFCRNLGIMVKSGLPITSAFETLSLATSNLVFKKSVATIQAGIEKGITIEEAIQKSKLGFFPKIATRMVGVGEKSGKLDESLLYLGNFFEDEVDNQAKNFSVILEPLILLVVGLSVAFVALAIISPIYQFTGSIKR